MSTAARKTLVWGGGAIGGVIAAQLQQAGESVTLVDIVAAHVERIREHGLELVSPDGESRRHALQAYTPDGLQGRYERIVLCVKGQHTHAATEMLAPHLAENGWVLSMQNGLTEHRVAAVVGAARTVGAHVNFAADYLEPGRIQYGGEGSLVIGAFEPEGAAHAQDAAALLRQAFADTRHTDNIQGYKWSKVCLGSMLFATATNDETMGEQFANPALQPLWQALASEVLAVARAAGIKPESFDGFDPDCFADPAQSDRVRQGLDQIAHHCNTAWVAKPRSGIWRDLYVRRRLTEVDPQITDIILHAERFGLRVPIVSCLVDMIREIERGQRGSDTANRLALMACIAR